jgi:hypothetical protein
MYKMPNPNLSKRKNHTRIIPFRAVIFQLGLVERFRFGQLSWVRAEGRHGFNDGSVAGASTQVAVERFNDVFDVDDGTGLVAQPVDTT